MSKLSRSIRTVTRQATLFSAKVIAVSGNRATVRLSSNGTVYRSLVVYGGQVSVNQMVKVDMTTDVPFVIAPAKPSEPAVSTDLLPATPKARVVQSGDITTIIVDIGNPPVVESPLPEQIPEPDGEDVISYPPTPEGLEDAIEDVGDNGTIYLPPGTFPGFDLGGTSGSGYYRENIHIVGAGRDKTFITDTIFASVSCFLADFTVEFVKSDANNYVGIYAQDHTRCDRVNTNVINNGTGMGIGAYADMELNLTFVRCNIRGSDSGVYLATSMFNLHFQLQAKAGYLISTPDVYDVTYDQGGDGIDLIWNARELVTGEWKSDGAWGIVTAKPQQMAGKEVHILWEITSGTTLTAPTNNPHKMEDMSYWVGYGGSIPQYILDGNQMAASDESYVEYINGTSGSSPYGLGDFIKWVWTASPDFEQGDDTQNSIWFAITRYVDPTHPGVAQTMSLVRAYIQDSDGNKENISPTRIWCRATETTFYGGQYDVHIGTYATFEHIYCLFTTVSNYGTITRLLEGQPPIYYGNEPLATYPGMIWIED